MSEQYSQRELESHFEEIKIQLDRIEAQTIRTNGRVNKLENWQSLIIGGASIISFIVIPTIVWIFNERTGAIRDNLAQAQSEISAHERLDLQRFNQL